MIDADPLRGLPSAPTDDRLTLTPTGRCVSAHLVARQARSASLAGIRGGSHDHAVDRDLLAGSHGRHIADDHPPSLYAFILGHPK
jgi:hypothetical protein